MCHVRGGLGWSVTDEGEVVCDGWPGGLIVSEWVGTNSGSGIGLHVFVTHDYLVGATARHCLGEKLSDETWPGFLECVVLWQENDGVCFRYQGRQGHLPGLRLADAQ